MATAPTSRAGRHTARLRRPATCCLCLSELAAGDKAQWDPRSRTYSCLPCGSGGREVRGVRAGTVAEREAERCRAEQRQRHEQLKAAHPIRARLRLRLFPEPDPGRVHEAGAVGERRLAELIEGVGRFGVDVLHDRRMPRSRTHIDHLVVTSAGVWVVEARIQPGELDAVALGRPGPRQRLVLAGESAAPVLSSLDAKVLAVRRALDAAGADEVDVRSALCLVGAQARPEQVPFEVRSHLVTWPTALRDSLLESGPYDADDRNALIRLLARSFGPPC